MIKIIFTLFFIVIFQFQAFGETLRASASFDEPIKSFYGTWHVTSKIESTNNPSKFNKLSVDIWNLSGQNNVLILENGLTGAISQIKIDEATQSIEGKKLKFTRVKEQKNSKYKYIQTETPEFILNGDIFKGYDTFKIEKYYLNGVIVSIDVVKYKVVGQRISGDKDFNGR